MKNNKGFTFVELLVVIALLSIVLILTISQVQRINTNSKIKLCKNKLSLIEESLNLYLDNNRELFSNNGLCEKEPVSNICYTSVFKIADHDIIDYDDKNKNIINPVNNNVLNDYKVKITYDSSNDKFSSEIQIKKENETVSDENYNTICGKSTGIKEEDNDRSFFEKKSYDFKIITIEEDGSEHELDSGQNSVKKAINEIGNYCKDLYFDRKDEYSYVNYKIENDTTVKCRYKKGYSLSIKKGNGIVVDIDKYTSKKYKLNESVIINFKIEGNYLYDSISCNVSDSCEYNPKDSTIKVTFKNEEDIELTINSKDMLNVGMYYENPDEDNKYDTDTSNNQLFATVDEAKEYCNNHIKENYVFNKETGYNENTNGCYYKLKRTNLSFDLSDTNIVSVLVDPGSNTMSGTITTITGYKYGQKITLKVNYKNGYEYDSIVCVSGECTLNDDGTITLVSYADSVSIAPKSKKIPPKYMIYHHYQDADDGNGYSSELKNNSVSVDDTISDSTLLSNFCDTVENYNYISSISYYDKSNNEVNCYYDRKLFNVTFRKGDKYVSGFNLVPSSNSAVTNANITDSSVNKTYRFGQEILTSISGYSSDYEYKSIICSDNTKCNISKNGIGKVVVPANDNLTLTYNSQDVVQTFNIYYHYQDANDGNGYSVLKNYTSNISLPANYDSSDPDSTNRDLINSKKICESESVASHYTYNNNLSYLDRSKKEINCYFDRELVSVTFDKSDSYVTGVTVAPTDNNSVGSTSITSTTTYKYRYGQEVFMKINGYVNDYMYKEVSCSNSNQCTIGNDGTTKVKPTGTLIVKPISKPIELAYKLYNHYQDSNNTNGYTILEIKDINVVLSIGDSANVTNFCGQEGKTGYTYYSAPSYIDRSKKEIDCYFNLN